MNQKLIRRQRLITVISVLFIVGMTALAISQIRLARSREQEAETRRKMKERAKQHREDMEAEQQSHRMQQAALSGRLKQSNASLRQLENILAVQNAMGEKPKDSANYAAFIGSPVCRQILEVAESQNFKAKIDCEVYKDYALDQKQLKALSDAADQHLSQFAVRVQTRYPRLTDEDMKYCYLYLLGLKEADIAALMQKAYSTVCDRSRKIKGVLGTEGELFPALRSLI